MIDRILFKKIKQRLGSGKAIVLIGPRQVGKTTLIHKVLENREYLFLDGDDTAVRSLLVDANTEEIKSIIGKNSTVFIDEAQRIENIGLTSKIITDQFKQVQLIISGSSAFEMGNKLNEPLTGRKWEYQLFPICWKEFEDNIGYLKATQQLGMRLLYGMYPDVINNIGDEIEVLKNLVNSYLYKDILAFNNIQKPEILEKLLRALAFQIGSEVSYNELAQLVGVDKNTVNKYIDILIKGYVIYKLPTFSKNLRNEIKFNQKIYFYDTGVRNMIIGNFNSFENRNDIGILWENFLISERLKMLNYNNSLTRSYFWRTKQQQEIDYVEEVEGEIVGYEFKWNPKAKIKIYKSFIKTYNSEIKTIHKDNFRTFLGE